MVPAATQGPISLSLRLRRGERGRGGGRGGGRVCGSVVTSLSSQCPGQAVGGTGADFYQNSSHHGKEFE